METNVETLKSIGEKRLKHIILMTSQKLTDCIGADEEQGLWIERLGLDRVDDKLDDCVLLREVVLRVAVRGVEDQGTDSKSLQGAVARHLGTVAEVARVESRLQEKKVVLYYWISASQWSCIILSRTRAPIPNFRSACLPTWNSGGRSPCGVSKEVL